LRWLYIRRPNLISATDAAVSVSSGGAEKEKQAGIVTLKRPEGGGAWGGVARFEFVSASAGLKAIFKSCPGE
jgi:hypothetical protein